MGNLRLHHVYKFVIFRRIVEMHCDFLYVPVSVHNLSQQALETLPACLNVLQMFGEERCACTVKPFVSLESKSQSNDI